MNPRLLFALTSRCCCSLLVEKEINVSLKLWPLLLGSSSFKCTTALLAALMSWSSSPFNYILLLLACTLVINLSLIDFRPLSLVHGLSDRYTAVCLNLVCRLIVFRVVPEFSVSTLYLKCGRLLNSTLLTNLQSTSLLNYDFPVL